MPLPPDFQFSQSRLQDYMDCARRFQLKSIDGVRWPAEIADPAEEHERHMRRGADFHHMIHQHHLGVPAQALSASAQDDDLARWWAAYQRSDYAAGGPLAGDRYPETLLAARVAGFRLIAKYDLLVINTDGATIIDWKTSARRPARKTLADRLQTRVYPFVLAQAAHRLDGQPAITPEQIRMTYWFAEDPDTPETFSYDTAQLQADTAYLHDLITEINTRNTFELTSDTRHCRFCTYRSLCDRGVQAGDMDTLDTLDDAETPDDLTFDFDQIGEIAF